MPTTQSFTRRIWGSTLNIELTRRRWSCLATGQISNFLPFVDRSQNPPIPNFQELVLLPKYLLFRVLFGLLLGLQKPRRRQLKSRMLALTVLLFVTLNISIYVSREVPSTSERRIVAARDDIGFMMTRARWGDACLLDTHFHCLAKSLIKLRRALASLSLHIYTPYYCLSHHLTVRSPKIPY